MDEDITKYLSFSEEESIRGIEKMISDRYDQYFTSLPLENVFIFSRLKNGLNKAKKEAIKDAYYFLL